MERQTSIRYLATGLSAAVVAFGLPTTVQANEKTLGPTEVFILAGQSNMEGRGMPISDGEIPIPNLVEWRAKQFVEAGDPLSDPTNPENGIGPGMSFGVSLVNDR